MLLANVRTQGHVRPFVHVDGNYVDVLSTAEKILPSMVSYIMDCLGDRRARALGPAAVIAADRAALDAVAYIAQAAQEDASFSVSLDLDKFGDDAIRPPVRTPSKIVGVGLNYREHCRETGHEFPSNPVLFGKFPSAITGTGCPIILPAASSEVDYEVELAAVIGRPARNVSEEEALEYVCGLTIANDVSARDFQSHSAQYTAGKNFDSFLPLGPYLSTIDNDGAGANIDLTTSLNGHMVQSANTNDMIFPLPALISYISTTCTLLPGDIILTGTPSGIGKRQSPPRYLKHGDVLEMRASGMGVLENHVIASSLGEAISA